MAAQGEFNDNVDPFTQGSVEYVHFDLKPDNSKIFKI